MSRHVADHDLLGLIDGEIAPARAAALEDHLESCRACAARCRDLRGVSNEAVRLSRPPRELTRAGEARQRVIDAMRSDVARRRAWRTRLVLTATAALLFLVARHESAVLHRSLIVERGALPIEALTPGLAQQVSTDELCGGVPRAIPEIPDALRIGVLRDYGMEHVPPAEYELDYLITPELGGLADRRNLWPEPYGLRSWNAHAKDVLENRLPRLVCRGVIDLATAQREIASNWIAAYKKYLSAEPAIELHARLLALPYARSTIGE